MLAWTASSTDLEHGLCSRKVEKVSDKMIDPPNVIIKSLFIVTVTTTHNFSSIMHGITKQSARITVVSVDSVDLLVNIPMLFDVKC